MIHCFLGAKPKQRPLPSNNIKRKTSWIYATRWRPPATARAIIDWSNNAYTRITIITIGGRLFYCVTWQSLAIDLEAMQIQCGDKDWILRPANLFLWRHNQSGSRAQHPGLFEDELGLKHQLITLCIWSSKSYIDTAENYCNIFYYM